MSILLYNNTNLTQKYEKKNFWDIGTYVPVTFGLYALLYNRSIFVVILTYLRKMYTSTKPIY